MLIQTTQLFTLRLRRDGDLAVTIREGPHGFGRHDDGTVVDEVHQVIGTPQPLDRGSA